MPDTIAADAAGTNGAALGLSGYASATNALALAAAGTNTASASSRALRSIGRTEPGRGGGKPPAISGGMDSGALVVTRNSSGASRIKPSVRAVFSPQPTSSSSETAGKKVLRRLIIRYL